MRGGATLLGVSTVVFFFEVLGYRAVPADRRPTPNSARMLQFIALNLGVLVGLGGVAIAVVGFIEEAC